MAHLHLKLSLISKVINGKETVYKRGKVRKTIIRNFLHNSVLNIFFKSGGSIASTTLPLVQQLHTCICDSKKEYFSTETKQLFHKIFLKNRNSLT